MENDIIYFIFTKNKYKMYVFMQYIINIIYIIINIYYYMENDMIDFNIKLTPSKTPFITETDIIYNDENKLFQIIGINNSTKCLIKEVGHYSDYNINYNISIHHFFLNMCDIHIIIPIYKLNEINNMRLIILELNITFENNIIGLFQYCFINDGPNILSFFNEKNNDLNTNNGIFVLYDSLENKIIKKYDEFINEQFVLNELIKYIE